MMTDNERLRQWLEDDSCEPFLCPAKYGQNILIKSKKDEQFRYLFHQYCYGDEIIQKRARFEYCGIFFKGGGLIYDSDDEFDLAGQELIAPRDRLQMKQDVQSGVRAIINDRVANDRSKLLIRELSSPQNIKSVDGFKSYGAIEKAKELFLNRESPQDISFCCEYEFGTWSEENLLEYIRDPAGFIRAEAETYWQENQEIMLLQFLNNEATAHELQAIIDAGDSELHRARNIIDAVERTGAQSVTVTIRKNGKEFEFKYGTDQLKRVPSRTYSTWPMAASDRAAFELLFNRYDDFTPGSIIRITFRKKIYYQAEPLTTAEEAPC